MTSARYQTPSITTIAAAASMALAAGFVRCASVKESVPPAAALPASAPAADVSVPSPVPPVAESAEPPPAAKQRCVVAVLGDSLTDARSSGGKYVEYLAKRSPESRFDNFGKGADMVNQIRKRFERDVLPNGVAYTHLVVFGGVNDLYSDLTAGRTPAKIEADLDAIYQAARGRGAKVVAITVAPWGGFSKYYNDKRATATRELNQWMLAQLREKKIEHAVDAFALLSCGDPERLCPDFAKPYGDGLHFGPAGHEKLGAALHEQVFASCR